MFLSVLRSVKPVSVRFDISVFREQSYTVHPSVRGLLPAGVRLQHWALLCPAVRGGEERLFREALSGTRFERARVITYKRLLVKKEDSVWQAFRRNDLYRCCCWMLDVFPQALEQSLDSLALTSFGVMDTTLEEVFLKVSEEDLSLENSDAG